MKKRYLFTELSEGFEALASERAGKRTLRTHEVRIQPPAVINAGGLLALRESLHFWRPVFARYLRTNPRTLENGVEPPQPAHHQTRGRAKHSDYEAIFDFGEEICEDELPTRATAFVREWTSAHQSGLLMMGLRERLILKGIFWGQFSNL